MTVGQLRQALRYLPEDAEVIVAVDGACMDAGFVSGTHVSLLQLRRLTESSDHQAHFIRRGYDGAPPEGPQGVVIGDKRSAIELIRRQANDTPDYAVDAVDAVEVSEDVAWSATNLIPRTED